MLEILFWSGVFIVFYAYIGYGILLFVLVKLKRLFSKKQYFPMQSDDYLPDVTFLVAAYNEQDYIQAKIKNSLALDYPSDKIQFVFVTDGSNDRTSELIYEYPRHETQQIHLFHQPERRGKIAAVERVMPFVNTPITIFTDANTDLPSDALRLMVRHFQHPQVGAVAGEKRISMGEASDASGAGEGIYWKYESLLKKWDSELYSVVGAAGELFAIRTDLFQAVPKDTLIEDFVMTMGIAKKGYKVVYEPEAYAVETSSASVGEELKRKIRIAAGGLQAVWRLRSLLFPFPFPTLTFQYLSHRVLRWTLAPLFLPIIFVCNLLLALQGSYFYMAIFALQSIFYTLSLIGWVLESRKIKVKAFFVPYYFCMMNYAMYRGLGRLLAGSQSVVWEKAKRA